MERRSGEGYECDGDTLGRWLAAIPMTRPDSSMEKAKTSALAIAREQVSSPVAT